MTDKTPANNYWRQLTPEQIEHGRHRTFVGGMWERIGELQLHFLVERGLKPHHRLLDVGCGALRGGLRFVDYLEPENYYGLDLNPSLIEAGRVELRKSDLMHKGAHLLADDAFRVDRFGQTFDYAIAVSLFTHLHLNLIGRCLKNVAGVLKPEGDFYASFFRAPEPLHLEPVARPPSKTVTNYDHDPYHQAPRELAFLARHAGLRARMVGEWGHPRGQKMAQFRPT